MRHLIVCKRATQGQCWLVIEKREKKLVRDRAKIHGKMTLILKRIAVLQSKQGKSPERNQFRYFYWLFIIYCDYFFFYIRIDSSRCQFVNCMKPEAVFL